MSLRVEADDSALFVDADRDQATHDLKSNAVTSHRLAHRDPGDLTFIGEKRNPANSNDLTVHRGQDVYAHLIVRIVDDRMGQMLLFDKDLLPNRVDRRFRVAPRYD
jgi:hypothetical protein